MGNYVMMMMMMITQWCCFFFLYFLYQWKKILSFKSKYLQTKHLCLAELLPGIHAENSLVLSVGGGRCYRKKWRERKLLGRQKHFKKHFKFKEVTAIFRLRGKGCGYCEVSTNSWYQCSVSRCGFSAYPTTLLYFVSFHILLSKQICKFLCIDISLL